MTLLPLKCILKFCVSVRYLYCCLLVDVDGILVSSHHVLAQREPNMQAHVKTYVIFIFLYNLLCY